MIRYSLACERDHKFEAWFRDMATFDQQAEIGALMCPYCGSAAVQKTIMAPHVARGASLPDGDARDVAAGAAPDAVPASRDPHEEIRERMRELREAILASTEDVGGRLPQEARRMRDGEATNRAIRGRASLEEAKALIEEGLPLLPLPGEGH